MLHEQLTEVIIGAFFKVYNVLGYGFLEKVYENAMAFELRQSGMIVGQQQCLKVYYLGVEMGEYFTDIQVNELVIIEVKSAENIREEHMAQLTNYLRATDREVGLLLNFGRKPEFRRVVFSNQHKDPRRTA